MVQVILTKLLVTGVLFVAALRAGVFAWAKLSKYSNPVLGVTAIASMFVLYPYIDLTSLFDRQVFPSFFVMHVCGGTIVCSVIAKWVEDQARKDLERESATTTQLGE